GGEARHLLLYARLDLVHGIVGGGRNQVLEHLAVLAAHRRLDLHALHLVTAVHGDLHHAAAGLTDHLDVGDLGLGLLHIGLHGLGLLHQIVEVTSHGIAHLWRSVGLPPWT